MLRQRRTDQTTRSARTIKARAERLSSDTKFRPELAAAFEHAARALQRAERVGGKRSHKLRNGLLLTAGGGAAAAAAKGGIRQKLTPAVTSMRPSPAADSVVQESLEVEVPVTTACNQWTQFERFPEFMDGVEEVQQLDNTRLHWVASLGGRRVEWDAKILEQHPDRQISWASEGGRKTRGSVNFEPLGKRRALVRLSMSYQLAGLRERLGAAGIDRRRVRGDLLRFKQLIESAGGQSGAWRGEVSAGDEQTAHTDARRRPRARRSKAD